MTTKHYDEFLKTYSGRKLLEEHSLDEEGTWEVKGEDPNCDFGGAHHEPHLGYFKGRLRDVIETAVELKGFWQWGGGGRIVKSSPRKVHKVTQNTMRDQKDIREKIEAMERELAELKKRLI